MYYSTKLGLPITRDVIFYTNGIQNTVLKAVHKYQRHPGILAIKEKYKDMKFSFSSVGLSDLENESKSLDYSKPVRKSDTHTKVLKKNAGIFSPFLLNFFNNVVDFSSFPNHLKLANIILLTKKIKEVIKETMDQLVYYQTYQIALKIS